MKILLISDIHGNFPALLAIDDFFAGRKHFDLIINCGDNLVYGPFPNETLAWLKKNNAVSILGNTDKKVIKLLQGKTFGKPAKSEKRIMYTWTAEVLTDKSKQTILSLKKHRIIRTGNDVGNLSHRTIGIFHGSPDHFEEFLFATTPATRFQELASTHPELDIIVCGHSHTPFHKTAGSSHFINPGSVGRMFDGDPRASCAVIHLTNDDVQVSHHRIAYNIEETIRGLRTAKLPEIYNTMYRTGTKT